MKRPPQDRAAVHTSGRNRPSPCAPTRLRRALWSPTGTPGMRSWSIGPIAAPARCRGRCSRGRWHLRCAASACPAREARR
eukprot:8341882-Heterocapsa_arctica.AAC.1